MCNGSGMVCLFAFLVLFAIASFFWQMSRGQDILDSWAQQNGFKILSRERKTLLTGPYFLSKSKGQDVYYVTVEYPDGRQRSGYVRVGGMFMGMLSDAIDVT